MPGARLDETTPPSISDESPRTAPVRRSAVGKTARTRRRSARGKRKKASPEGGAWLANGTYGGKLLRDQFPVPRRTRGVCFNHRAVACPAGLGPLMVNRFRRVKTHDTRVAAGTRSGR